MARLKNMITEWASTAAENRVRDPGATMSGKGFEATSRPFFEHLNWLWNTLSHITKNWEQNGIMEWHAATIYAEGALTKGADGLLYRSKSAGNTGNAVSNATYWERWPRRDKAVEFIALTGTLPTRRRTNAGTSTDTVTLANLAANGLSAGQIAAIRSLHVWCWVGYNNFLASTGESSISATFPDGSTRILLKEVQIKNESEATMSGMAEVPVNAGQVAVTMTNKATFTWHAPSSYVEWVIIGVTLSAD